LIDNFFKLPIAEPIIGENVRRAEANEFPAIVSFMTINEGVEDLEEEHFCTGTLLTSSHVLTAAHCLENVQKNETQIVLGSVDLRCGLVYYPLWWVNYNEWASVRRVHLQFVVNDIAIVKASNMGLMHKIK
jgi:hypothetical protein